MKIFVTGGAGFIGSHVVAGLSQKHSVTVWDNHTSSVDPLPDNKKINYLKGDILDTEKLIVAMKNHDLVIHMAAAHLRLSMEKPFEVHAINTTGTLSTLLATKKNHIRRYIYISSSEAYGSATTTTMKESHAISPTTIYGTSKYIGELYTQHFQHFENLKTTIIRPFNTYGPRSHFDGPYGEVIPRMVIRVLNGLPPVIFGDGSQTRDFTHVSDTARGIITAALSQDTMGETLNIAYGKEIAIKRIATIICQTINPEIKPVYKDARPNDVARHAADTKKAQRIIGWKPTMAIEEGIPHYVAWIKERYPDIQKLMEKIPEKNW